MRRGITKLTSTRGNRFSCEQLEPRLMLDGVTDNFADSFEHAALIDLAIEFPQAAIVGSIESSFDRDVYRFTVPDHLGVDAPLLLKVRQQAITPNDRLDSLLSVFNGAGMLLASNDDFEGSTNSELSLLVLPGGTYFVQAAGFFDTSGDYRITLEFAQGSDELPELNPASNETDDFPSSPAEVELEALNSRGLAAFAGSLEKPGDIDAFRFTATSSGPVLVRAVRFPAGGFVGQLEIVDENGVLLASADDDGAIYPATELTVFLDAAANYGIRVSGLSNSTGEYVVTVSPLHRPDDFGDTITSAYHLNHPLSGRSRLPGEINSTDDMDVVRFTVATAGTNELILRPRGSKTLVPALIARDADGNSLGTATTLADATVLLSFQAAADQIVYAFVTGQHESTGEYFLDVMASEVSLTPDDFYDNPATIPRAMIELSTSGFGAQSGLMNSTSDVDVFEFVAPFDGTVWLKRSRAVGSSLRSDVSVFDISTLPATIPLTLGPSDDTDPTGDDPTGGKEESFVVVANRHYLVRIRAQEGTGGYDLAFRGAPNAAPAHDEPGNEFEHAVAITLRENGRGTAAGLIDSADDVDFYQFDAPVTGKVLITQSAGSAGLHSRLAAFDAIFDENENQIVFTELARNSGHAGQLDALVAFEIIQGKTYYLRAGARDGLGPYALSIRAIEGGLSITPLGAPHDGETLDALDLVMELLGGSLASDSIEVDPETIEYLGADIASGVFTGAGDLFASSGVAGFDRGIILTTGKAANAIGPNFAPGSQQDNGITAVDPRFAGLVAQLTNGKPAFDTSILAFAFTPDTDVIQLRFAFASEEYPEYVLKGFSDVFGVFVNGVNYARVPGTDHYIAGTGEVISIDTINQVSHQDFFIDNATRPTAPYGPLDLEYDGLTTVITLTIPVKVGKSNEMVLVIADVNDRVNDSAVFVQAASLRSPRETVDRPSGEALRADFSTIVEAVGGVPLDATPEDQHLAIHRQFIYEFLKQLGVPLVGGVLVIAVDPVDYTLLGPNGTVGTVDRSGGSVNLPNAFYTSNGTEDLIIIPNARLADYSVQFTGVGERDFRFGASYIAPDGAVTTRLWQSSPTGRFTTEVAFDFRTLTGDVVVESITLTQNLRPPITSVAPSLDGVFFAVATAGRAPFTQTSLTTTSNSGGGGDDSGGGDGGGSPAGGSATPTATRLANTGSAGGKVRTGRPGALDIVSEYLDEILREIGGGGDDRAPASPRLRSFLRALLFRVHVPFLFPLDLGNEPAPSAAVPSGDSNLSPQAEIPVKSPSEQHAQVEAPSANAHRTNAEHFAAIGQATASWVSPSTAEAHRRSESTTLSSPRGSDAAHTRLLGAAAVALCLSLSARNPWLSSDDRRRRGRVESRSSLETTCHREMRRLRKQDCSCRGQIASLGIKAISRLSISGSKRKQRFRRSSRGCFV